MLSEALGEVVTIEALGDGRFEIRFRYGPRPNDPVHAYKWLRLHRCALVGIELRNQLAQCELDLIEMPRVRRMHTTTRTIR